MEDQNSPPLLQAAMKNNMEEVKRLILNGVEINVQSPYYGTALHFASKNENEEMVELLIKNGAEVNAKSLFMQDIPLHLAAHNKNHKIVALLIENGAKIDAKDRCGRIPLHYAALENQTTVMDILMQNGSKVDQIDDFYKTPLHFAASFNSKASVEFLLKLGADVHVQCFELETPLHKAAKTGNLEIIKILMQNGASVKDGLHYAGTTQLVDFFIQHGEDINSKRETRQESPLHNLAHSGFNDSLQLLLNKGADIEVKSLHGSTPLHTAVNGIFGSKTSVETLIKNHANIDAQDNSGRTPLMNAIDTMKEATAQMLVANGASLNHRNMSKNTVFECAISNDAPLSSYKLKFLKLLSYNAMQ